MISSNNGWPGKIVSGEGSLGTIGEEVRQLGGKKAVLFSGPHISKTAMVAGAIECMEKEGVEVCLFNRIGPNPTDEMVMDGVEEMKKFQPDVMVCIGGGSPIDCAKAANVVYTHGGAVED